MTHRHHLRPVDAGRSPAAEAETARDINGASSEPRTHAHGAEAIGRAERMRAVSDMLGGIAWREDVGPATAPAAATSAVSLQELPRLRVTDDPAVAATGGGGGSSVSGLQDASRDPVQLELGLDADRRVNEPDGDPGAPAAAGTDADGGGGGGGSSGGGSANGGGTNAGRFMPAGASSAGASQGSAAIARMRPDAAPNAIAAAKRNDPVARATGVRKPAAVQPLARGLPGVPLGALPQRRSGGVVLWSSVFIACAGLALMAALSPGGDPGEDDHQQTSQRGADATGGADAAADRCTQPSSSCER